MGEDGQSREERRAGRGDWPVAVRRLGDEGSDDVEQYRSCSVAERVAAVRQLTVASWQLAGRDPPEYSRSEIPVRVVEREFPDPPEGAE